MKILSPQQNLSKRQTDILILLYRFRFLNRLHIQNLLNHKYRSRILSWLNELTNQNYTKQYYDKTIASSPSVYSLDSKGRKYLKSLKEGNIKQALLDRVWREAKYSSKFREHCLSLADIYISLLAITEKNKSTLHFYTKTDLHGTEHFISPAPDAHFAIEEKKGQIIRYFLEILDDIPPAAHRRRVAQYFKYYASGDWQDNTDKPFPEIIFICPNTRTKGHLFYYIRKKLSGEPEMSFYLTTKELVDSKGLNGETLQKVLEEE
ncbi:MAG: replication-relaxation family protein [bacterium]|nr:replication-relaxation family protein [bacterium]